MDSRTGWALAAVAFVAGWFMEGWRGIALVFSVVVFWLLLQFGRGLRVLRDARAAPLGRVANAPMLHARLRPGLTLLQIVALAGSLGRKLGDAPETFAWSDAGGDRVVVEMSRGRCAHFRLERAASGAAAT